MKDTKNKMKLILFDIDGTLIHTGGAGRYAMIRAFEEIFGTPNGFDNISMAGKTDPQIIQLALKEHNLIGEEQLIEKFKLVYLKILVENIKKDLPKKRIYPGVTDLLEALNGYSNATMGLLTGNWQEGAKIKLEYFDLLKYFSFGAFGSDSMDRDELLPFALKRFKENTNQTISPTETVVIGDTPSDVQCAKVHGAKSLGVATGRYTISDLKQKGADWATEDLLEIDKIINWILR